MMMMMMMMMMIMIMMHFQDLSVFTPPPLLSDFDDSDDESDKVIDIINSLLVSAMLTQFLHLIN